MRTNLKKILLRSSLILTSLLPSFSHPLKYFGKATAEAVATFTCYANPQYQNDKGECEVRFMSWDKNWKTEYRQKEPIKIRVKKDGIVDYKGVKWRIFYYDLYDKYNESEGGGFVMINLNPPQYFEKREEARCNRRHIRRPSFIAGVNGAYTAGINGSYTAGINGSYTAGVNGAYTAGVTPLEDDCK